MKARRPELALWQTQITCDDAPVTDGPGVRTALAALGVRPAEIGADDPELGILLVASPDLARGDWQTDGT